MKKGKLIVIEGSDGSGKATQSQILYERLKREGEDVRLISFPNYESPSSGLIKMYLGGEFGDSPEDSNIYAVSTFYACDRYASFVKDWREFYENGGTIICDRYTTSNMVHQSAKLSNRYLQIKYLNWLTELEYEKFKLPRPDMVFFLDVPTEISQKLMESRKNKFTNNEEKDIHEKNKFFMEKSYETAKFVAEHFDWKTIKCHNGESILSREDIASEVYASLEPKVPEPSPAQWDVPVSSDLLHFNNI